MIDETGERKGSLGVTISRLQGAHLRVARSKKVPMKQGLQKSDG